MNGIEIGNVLGNMAAEQQKNRPSEMKNVRAARTSEEASAKYEEAGENTNESAVSWVRGRKDAKAIENAENPPWSYTGKHPGTSRFKERNNSLVPPLADRADSRNSVDQTGKKDLNAVNSNEKNSKKDAGQIGKNNQTANASTSLTETRTNLSMVDRQRLAQQKKARAKAKKKNLNYNRREVSSQVLRASKLGMAARALATARTKASSLRRLVGTGQYDENELRIAIAHAESIVKTAKKKLSNLKEEQLKEKRVSREKQTNALKNQVKKQRVRAKRQQIKRELAVQRTQQERQMRAKELRVKQIKRRHRGEELADVAEADIKYIKDMDRYRRYSGTESSGRNTTNTTGTTALEIGDSAMRLSDLERTEQALKYEEQQMAQETADFSGSSASGSIDLSVGGSLGQVQGGDGSGAADMAMTGGTVDISL